MKTYQALTVVGLVIAFVCVIAGLVAVRREVAQTAAWKRAAAKQAALDNASSQEQSDTRKAVEPALAEPAAPEPIASPVNGVSPALVPRTDAKGPIRNPTLPPAASPLQAPPSTKPPLQDPVAREALGWVGVDPAANEYWVMAINDLSLPDNERQDLIEDLNEEGFADPKNLTPDDLPLIMSRLLLIEQLAPEAADKVNAEAFAEAYKDLVNLLVRLLQQ